MVWCFIEGVIQDVVGVCVCGCDWDFQWYRWPLPEPPAAVVYLLERCW